MDLPAGEPRYRTSRPALGLFFFLIHCCNHGLKVFLAPPPLGSVTLYPIVARFFFPPLDPWSDPGFSWLGRSSIIGGSGGSSCRGSTVLCGRMLLGTMNFLLSVLWGLPFLLSIHTAQLSQAAPTHGKEHKSTDMIPFLEVYNRSSCQVRETLVDVLQEYPDEVEYIFKPSCVLLMRCTGCCNDETLECVPTGWYNTTMEILRVHPRFVANYFKMSFQEHKRCACRPKNEFKGQQEK